MDYVLYWAKEEGRRSTLSDTKCLGTPTVQEHDETELKIHSKNSGFVSATLLAFLDVPSKATVDAYFNKKPPMTKK